MLADGLLFYNWRLLSGGGEGVEGEGARIPARGEQKLQNTVTIVQKKNTSVTLMLAKFRVFIKYLFEE